MAKDDVKFSKRTTPKVKYGIIQVTQTVEYMVPLYDKAVGEGAELTGKEITLNGWTVNELIKDWFETHPSDRHHASRDSHQVGNSTKIVSVKKLTQVG